MSVFYTVTVGVSWHTPLDDWCRVSRATHRQIPEVRNWNAKITSIAIEAVKRLKHAITDASDVGGDSAKMQARFPTDRNVVRTLPHRVISRELSVWLATTVTPLSLSDNFNGRTTMTRPPVDGEYIVNWAAFISSDATPTLHAWSILVSRSQIVNRSENGYGWDNYMTVTGYNNKVQIKFLKTRGRNKQNSCWQAGARLHFDTDHVHDYTPFPLQCYVLVARTTFSVRIPSHTTIYKTCSLTMWSKYLHIVTMFYTVPQYINRTTNTEMHIRYVGPYDIHTSVHEDVSLFTCHNALTCGWKKILYIYYILFFLGLFPISGRRI